MKKYLIISSIFLASCGSKQTGSVNIADVPTVLDREISEMRSRLTILKDADGSTFIDTLRSSASIRKEFEKINEMDSILKIFSADTSNSTKQKIETLRMVLDSLNVVEMPYIRSAYSLVRSTELTAKHGYDINASLPAWYQSGKRVVYEKKDPNGAVSIYSMPYNDNLFLQSAGFIQPAICDKIYSELSLDFKIYKFKKVYFQTGFDMHSVVSVYKIDGSDILKLK